MTGLVGHRDAHREINLREEKMPFGTWGNTCFGTNTITIHTGLNAAERRCTLLHELIHLDRGAPDVEDAELEEALVDLLVAAKLLRPRALKTLQDDVAKMGESAVAELHRVDKFIVRTGLRLADAAHDLLPGNDA